MRKIAFFILLLLLSSNLFSIEINRKFGKVSKEELSMKFYEKDSSANAVILFDVGKTKFEYDIEKGFQMIYERHIRIKILNEDGFDYANFNFSLYHEGQNSETLSKLKAETYNLESGKVVKLKLKNKDIYEIKDTRNKTIKKFSLPSVKNGSVIEVNYRIVSDFFYNLQKWKFQHFIPCIWSEYTVEIPEYFLYNKIAKGYLSFAINESEQKSDFISITTKSRSEGGPTVKTDFSMQKIDFIKHVFKLAVKDAPAMKMEKHMLAADNYLSSIEFELAQINFPGSPAKNYSKNWESINKELLGHPDFGDQIKNGNYLKEVVENIKNTTSNPTERIFLLHSYVINNFKWNERNDLFTSRSLKKTFNEKNGNSADLNLLMVLLLREAGFNAHPVILSTRNHGLLNLVYPSVTQMNYVIALLEYEGQNILLDATDPYCLPGMLPPRCINDKGRIIKKDNSTWINIEPKEKYFSTTLGNCKIDENKIQGNVSIKKNGFASYNFRHSYKSHNSEQEFISEIENNNAGIKINEYQFEHIDSLHKPIQYKFSEIEFDSYDNLGNLIYFNPVMVDKISENPFKMEERMYPVDYNYLYDQKYIFNYSLPEGYVVEELPHNEKIILPENSASYYYAIKNTGNIIQIIIRFNINKRKFLPGEYQHLKDLYNKIIAKEKEQIVIKKL